MTGENTDKPKLGDEVRLVDFDTVKKMLEAGEIQTLIGYTKNGEPLAAAENRADLGSLEVKGEYPAPEPAQMLFGYFPFCCAHGEWHWPFSNRNGWYCLKVGGGCWPDSCGPCTHLD